MTICETYPLCPDETVDLDKDRLLTEPVEVGPFSEGIVFVQIQEITDKSSIEIDVGVSPTGYESWDHHWATLDSKTFESESMHKLRILNFGNWIRLQVRYHGNTDGDVKFQAWFVGKE